MTPRYDGDDTERLLRSVHASSDSSPIEGCDADGVFGEPPFSAWLQGDAYPLVVDTNVYFQDLRRRLRTRKRTALVNAANSRAIRLYSTPQVVAEVYEHAIDSAREIGLSRDDLLTVWEESYLPLVRCVDAAGLEAMLLPDERARIDALRARDPDDVPSATLAAATGAVFLTNDRAAHAAAHGRNASTQELDQWLALVRDGGDVSELERLLRTAVAAPSVATIAFVQGATWLYRRSRPAFFAAATLCAAAAICVPADQRRAVLHGAGAAWTQIWDVVGLPHAERAGRLEAALPPFPAWGALTQSTGKDAALARACLYRLVRTRRTPARAGGLASQVPEIGAGRNASRVGKILRRYRCFAQPRPGRWQVGGRGDQAGTYSEQSAAVG